MEWPSFGHAPFMFQPSSPLAWLYQDLMSRASPFGAHGWVSIDKLEREQGHAGLRVESRRSEKGLGAAF